MTGRPLIDVLAEAGYLDDDICHLPPACTVCGRGTTTRLGSRWCRGCQAWVLDHATPLDVIDLRDPTPTRKEHQ